ncbi:Ig-like domain-containing protein [uncultured Cocleimonas sp.]|uniref:Ig-like domain-containing protein n=1 Tax=uncultured Cocleimonas sp. TaxID=1051587 RepID=UPI002633983E|nr:Ig-like domain-containing protein [uncultured Cocleimonas sp.]
MKLNGFLSIVFAASLSIILSACGGGGSSSSTTSDSTNNSSTNNTTDVVISEAPSVTSLPRIVNITNWKSSPSPTPQSDTDLDVEVVGNELLITIQSDNLSHGDHVQIYLDTDNTAATGFQFENQAWSQSGVDYIIEDGDLFKSTASDTTWSWNTNVGDITYAVSLDKLKINIDIALLGEICNNVNVGVMTRDNDWNIATFYPISAKMQAFTLSYCSTTVVDTEAPVLTLTGANPLSLEVGSIYNELGATAVDHVDGDISTAIVIKSNVNTAVAGSYTVNYSVKDNAGNKASKTRKVEITAVTPEGITIDGNASDWINIPTLMSSSNGIMKVTDDADKIYFMVNADNLNKNTQIFMDTDNKSNTGFDLAAYMPNWQAGADYMIENSLLDKSTSNSPQWAWDYGVNNIEFSKVGNILEIAIKKSDFEYLGNIIPMSFMSRDENWNEVYRIPEQAMPIYTLLFPTNSNQVSANNDAITVANSGTINIDVLANDLSYTNSALKIRAIENGPNHGTVNIVSNKIKYTATSGYTGSDSFTYSITDSATGSYQDTATVTIEVSAPTNTAPIANNDSASVPYNTQIAIDVIDNDSDADGDTLKITGIGEAGNGQAVISGENIIYTPDTGFSGPDSVSYEINDGKGGTASATLNIKVLERPNTVPDARNDSASTVGTTPKNITVLANDTDPEGDTLTVTNVTIPSNGTATLNTTTKKIRYIAKNGFSGTDKFKYTISDGYGGTDTATVTVTVTPPPPNNAPDAVEDSAGVDFDKTKTVNVLANDTDPDGDTLSVVSIVQPPLGFAVLNNDGTIFFDPQSNVGSITVTYTISDGRGGSDTATLTFSSTDPNDGNDSYPEIYNEVVSTPKNTPIFIDVLANDSDADGDVLILDQVDQGQNGTTTKVNGGVLYTPNPGFTGTNIFYYGVHDGHGHNGSGNVTVTVTP